MKANELRMGNLALRADGWSGDKAVMFGEHPYEIDSLDFKYAGIHDFPDFKGCMDVEYKDLKGIDITESWLRDKELIKGDSCLLFTFGESGSCYFENGKVLIEQGRAYAECLKHVKYVHQLQNLCFELTEKELL